jgi:dephospho-CoA kinase
LNPSRRTADARSSPPLVIGLTGGIGSGKSAASAIFSRLGAPVIDADRIAHALVAPGESALAEIAAAFGTDILGSDGELDRDTLRRRVFADNGDRKRLEAILHPRIRRRIQNFIRNTHYPYCVVVIPLLLETQQSDLVDRILVIDIPPETQASRVADRDGLDRQEIQAIIDVQAARETRLSAADDIIDNTGGLDALESQVRGLHDRYLEIAAGRSVS